MIRKLEACATTLSTRAVDKVGARVCDPQQPVPIIAAFGAIRSVFLQITMLRVTDRSQTRAPILTLSTALLCPPPCELFYSPIIFLVATLRRDSSPDLHGSQSAHDRH